MIDCDCTEYWTPRESCDGEMLYAYTFLVSPECPLHWSRYVANMEMIERMREDAAHQ